MEEACKHAARETDNFTDHVKNVTPDINETNILCFPVLIEAVSLRNANGIPRNDYHRYRSYCSRKLRKIRSTLRFKCGRHRYVHKPLPAKITDKNYLLLVLVSAERAWSYAVQLKSNNAAATVYNSRAHHHGIRKLAKAAKYGELLSDLCKSYCDKKSAIDAEAYSSWLLGILYIEYKNCLKAVEFLKNAHKIFSQLKRISVNNLYEHTTYSKQLEEIETSLRLCKYDLERSGIDCDDLLRIGGVEYPDALNYETLLRMATEGVSGILVYKGIQIKSPSKRVNMRLNGLITLMEKRCIKLTDDWNDIDCTTKDIIKVETSGCIERERWYNFCKDVSPSTVIENYGEVSVLLNELLESIHSEMILSDSENENTAWSITEGYVFDLLSCVDIERNVLLEIMFFQRLRNYTEDNSFSRIRLDEGIRYADLLIQAVKKILDANCVSEDVEVLLIQCLEMLRLTRGVCLSFHYASMQQYAEAYVLAHWVISSGECEFPIHSLDKSDSYRRIAAYFLILQDAVFFYAKRLKCYQLANTVLAAKIGTESTNFDEKEAPDIEDIIFKSGSFPPKLIPIPCKPLVIDLAIFNVEPPDVTSRTEEKKSSLMSKLKSIWKF